MKKNVGYFKRVFMLVGVFISTILPLAATAAPILQNQSTNSYQMQHWQPIGQSFTAEDSIVECIGIYIAPSNPSLDLSGINFKLFEGEGFAGNIIQSEVFKPSAGYTGWLDMNVKSVDFNVGSKYTIALSTYTPYWGILISSNDVYAGGQAYHANIAGQTNVDYKDLKFHVNPVPIPAAIWLFGVGIASIVGFRRRKNIV